MQDVRLLIQFTAVAEALSFSQAARKLRVAQPWLSARMRKLEEQLETSLFVRTTRRVELTPDGRRLLDLVLPLVQLADEIDGKIATWREKVRERIRIGCPQLGEPDRYQAALLTRFAAAYPDIVIDVEPGRGDRHAELIERGALDLMLAVRTEPPQRWEWLRLHQLSMAVMLHGDHPLAGKELLTVSMLSGKRVAMVAPKDAGGLHDQLYGPLVKAGAVPVIVPELRRSLLQSSPALIVTTLVPSPADAQLRHGIIRKTIADAPPVWLMLMRPDDTPSSRAAQRFWQVASELYGHDTQD